MRLATLILSLILMLVILFQSCAAALGGAISSDTATGGAAAVGILLALLFLLGAAFVIPWPIVSVVVFSLGGIVALSARSGAFKDLAVWGVVSLIFAVMSFFGWRGKQQTGRKSDV